MPGGELAAWARHAADPLEVVPAEAWEPHWGEDEPLRLGVVLTHLMAISGEIYPGGRTPCREGHYIIMHISSTEDMAPVVGCQIFTWEEHSRYRKDLQSEEALREAQAGQRRGYLPVLLPRAGYDTEPNVFIWIAAQRAFPYRQISRSAGARQGTLRLEEEYVTPFLSAFARHHHPE